MIEQNKYQVMRRILILLGFVLGVLSAHAESKSYTINDMFTISVDSKLELRDKKGLYEQKTKNNNLPVTSDEVIVFQQTGLNNDTKAAYQKYARIMIQTEISNEGDYSYMMALMNYQTMMSSILIALPIKNWHPKCI